MKQGGSNSELTLKAISHPGIGVIDRISIYKSDGLLFEQMNTEMLDSLEIKKTITIKNSQWVAAAVYCDNGAVAHTTPVYIIVDGQPTWNTETAPDIICGILGALELMVDMEEASLFKDQGLLERMGLAQDYYEKLLIEIETRE